MTTSMTPKHSASRLTADVEEVAPVAPESVAPAGERESRFNDGVRTLRVAGASFRLEERLLMVMGGVIAPLGFVIVLLGWWGASHTPYVFEQVPYLISGGLLGVGMVFLGAFLYFTHWLTQLVKEHRTQSVTVLEALQRLTDEVARQGDGRPAARGTSANGSLGDEPVELVATARGTMAHRPDCPVVAGKAGLRHVTADDGLSTCRLCG